MRVAGVPSNLRLPRHRGGHRFPALSLSGRSGRCRCRNNIDRPAQILRGRPFDYAQDRVTASTTPSGVGGLSLRPHRSTSTGQHKFLRGRPFDYAQDRVTAPTTPSGVGSLSLRPHRSASVRVAHLLRGRPFEYAQGRVTASTAPTPAATPDALPATHRPDSRSDRGPTQRRYADRAWRRGRRVPVSLKAQLPRRGSGR
jgi:hypothetical protein